MAAEELTGKQKRFCEEYIFDFNGARAARAAGYSEDTAAAIASENLTKPNIKAYIQELQDDLAKTSGISKLKVLREHEKIAFGSIAHLHNTWIERKEFENLTEEQKACISEISTQTRVERVDKGTKDEALIDVDYVKIKLFDKQKALESISRLLGFDAPIKSDITTDGKQIKGFVLNIKPRRDSNNTADATDPV